MIRRAGWGAYEFNDLTTDDVLHKVHGLRRGILDLAKDEHLEPRAHEGRSETIPGWFWAPE